ncbi:hypothetical protein CEXT_397301 [Caerostris extrusa]|uniref:Uncharacterized protein n=1 Tax=Caerostris extrusa TaxID=172846 RepID=A0AAV4RA66_CAEEX|nr:hypothetical protein CEXT_397301 [Caerostris extrusa]
MVFSFGWLAIYTKDAKPPPLIGGNMKMAVHLGVCKCAISEAIVHCDHNSSRNKTSTGSRAANRSDSLGLFLFYFVQSEFWRYFEFPKEKRERENCKRDTLAGLDPEFSVNNAGTRVVDSCFNSVYSCLGNPQTGML